MSNQDTSIPTSRGMYNKLENSDNQHTPQESSEGVVFTEKDSIPKEGIGQPRSSVGTLHNKDVFDEHEKLLEKIGSLQLKLKSKSTSASILAILQKCPCLMRCEHDISNPSFDNNIDSLYIAKHEFVKTKLMDTLVYKFGDRMAISSEHTIKAGKLDIAILPDHRILLKSNNENIAIEIKSGKSIDLFQIERYLFEIDKLVALRVPTQDVFLVNALSIENWSLRSIDLVTSKIDNILSGNLHKVRGEGCRGCTAQCEYRAKSRHNNNGNHGPQLDYENFVKNTYEVIDKAIAMVERELRREPK